TDENGAQPIYLFEGEEVYFHIKGEELLKSRFVQEPSLDYIAFDGASLKGENLRKLTEALDFFPFVSQKRLVKVTEFYPTEKDYETYLKRTFENSNFESILLIINSAKAKTGCAVLAKKPNVTLVDCARSDEETIKRWVYLTCKREGIYVDGASCERLTAYCVGDMSRIAKETEKLLCYCQAKETTHLTDEIIDSLVYPDAEYKIYELATALSKRNHSAFMRISQELLTKGYNEHAQLSSLAGYFKNVYDCSVASGSEKEIAMELGLREFGVKKNREHAKLLGKDGALRLYQATYGAISQVKCGKRTPQSAMQEVIAQLFFG
ncbi:MAG: hypothetical protein IJ996_04590, partial [Clostridia bacterium]|nr:hypothetical protein [Clostridia bacterium]